MTSPNTMRTLTDYAPASIALYTHGFEVMAPTMRTPPPVRGTSRGEIVGWSAHSRLRFRRWLLMHEPVGDAFEYNVTLTVPGPPLSPAEMRKLWHRFSVDLKRSGRSAVWRLEVQARGSVHWHLIMSVPKDIAGKIAKDQPAYPVLERLVVEKYWKQALDSLGPVKCESVSWDFETDPSRRKKQVFEFPSRSQIPFAFEIPDWALGPGSKTRAVDCVQAPPGTEQWAWRRYMQDHASKAKQEQIAQGFGRHWGVIGRSRYKAAFPDFFEALTVPQIDAVLRWLQHLTGGTVKAPRAPFGYKRAPRRTYRGKHGRSVWFSRPDTIRRMIELARELYPGDLDA